MSNNKNEIKYLEVKKKTNQIFGSGSRWERPSERSREWDSHWIKLLIVQWRGVGMLWGSVPWSPCTHRLLVQVSLQTACSGPLPWRTVSPCSLWAVLLYDSHSQRQLVWSWAFLSQHVIKSSRTWDNFYELFLRKPNPGRISGGVRRDIGLRVVKND